MEAGLGGGREGGRERSKSGRTFQRERGPDSLLLEVLPAAMLVPRPTQPTALGE